MTEGADRTPASLPGPAKGEVAYLQIPARDVTQSAEFYAHVFGWHVEHPNPSFETPNLIGQWVTDRTAAGDGGMLAWIHVDNIQVALEMVRSDGGEVLEQPIADGPATACNHPGSGGERDRHRAAGAALDHE